MRKINKFEYLEQNKNKITIRIKGMNIIEKEFANVDEANKAYLLLREVYHSK